MPDMVSDMVCVLQHANLQHKVVCVGHDWGSQVSCYPQRDLVRELVAKTFSCIDMPRNGANAARPRGGCRWSRASIHTCRRPFPPSRAALRSRTASKLHRKPRLITLPFFFFCPKVLKTPVCAGIFREADLRGECGDGCFYPSFSQSSIPQFRITAPH